MPIEIQSKTILNRSKIRDKWFLDDYTLNPYSGCSFNCLYCYIRGSKYGIHMDRSLSVKINAAPLLEKKLARLAEKGEYGIIVLSSASDPYLQVEKEYRLTRKLLEIILKYRFPVHVITKSDLVLRDFDILKEIDEKSVLPDNLQNKLKHKVFITFSFSTLDDSISKIFEPGAVPPSIRFETLSKTLAAEFHSGVSLMPLLPFITDTGDNLEYMYGEFSKTGVKYLFASSLTLFGSGPSDSKTLFINAVKKHYPHLAEKYEKFFSGNNGMPGYYHEALRKKTDELGKKYGLKNSII
jgi:DNA repair photolyase